jgi:hypothetical protein
MLALGFVERLILGSSQHLEVRSGNRENRPKLVHMGDVPTAARVLECPR